MLTQIVENIWIDERKLRFLGVETGTRMTIVRLSDESLFIHSPVSLEDGLRAQVDALGQVKAVVAPSLFHHLSVGQWQEAYPEAVFCACPGLEKKRPELRWDRILGDEPEPEWAADIEQVFFAARKLENEVVFFHRPSQTMVCADMIFNLRKHPSRMTRLVALLLGNWKPGATFLEHIMIRDRSGARDQIARMLAWEPSRILLAHGPPILEHGQDVLRRAYAWL